MDTLGIVQALKSGRGKLSRVRAQASHSQVILGWVTVGDWLPKLSAAKQEEMHRLLRERAERRKDTQTRIMAKGLAERLTEKYGVDERHGDEIREWLRSVLQWSPPTHHGTRSTREFDDALQLLCGKKSPHSSYCPGCERVSD